MADQLLFHSLILIYLHCVLSLSNPLRSCNLSLIYLFYAKFFFNNLMGLPSMFGFQSFNGFMLGPVQIGVCFR